MRLASVLALVMFLPACASVSRGTIEDVAVQVTPPNATITTSLNQSCTALPCIIKAKRTDDFTVTAAAPGYQSQTVNVGRVQKPGALAGNIIAGGMIGYMVDKKNGADMDHTPNPVIIDLAPVGKAKPRLKKPASTVPMT